VTVEDIRNIPQFKDQTLIAIKAPSGSTLAVPYPDQAAQTLEELKYQIFLNSREGPVEIVVVSSSRDDEGRCLFPCAPACTCAAACPGVLPWDLCHASLSCVPCRNCACARHGFAVIRFRPDEDVDPPCDAVMTLATTMRQWTTRTGGSGRNRSTGGSSNMRCRRPCKRAVTRAGNQEAFPTSTVALHEQCSGARETGRKRKALRLHVCQHVCWCVCAPRECAHVFVSWECKKDCETWRETLRARKHTAFEGFGRCSSEVAGLRPRC